MKTLKLLLMMLVVMTAASCSKDDSSNNTQPGKATLSVRMVDAPDANYEAVNIEVLSIKAHIDSAWIDFPLATPGVFNLLDFTNGNSLLLLGDTSIPAGTMSELRLVLGENNSVVVDGVTYPLQTPSGQTSGYKVKMNSQPLQAGVVYNLVIDFDVSKSVHMTGNGKYMLKPVVNGYLETAVGGIAGTITPPAGAFYVEAANGTDTSGTYIDTVTGQFLVTPVVPGTYNVTFTANTGFSNKTVTGVVVAAGQTTQMGTITIE